MTHGHPGRFIVVEGADGAGTTTISKALATRLGPRALWTCEPSAGPIGSLIRLWLTHRIQARGDADVVRTRMALLFCADRVDHLAQTVVPALETGRVVVSDRYYHSTLVYQSRALQPTTVEDGLFDPATLDDFAWVRALHREALIPDLTLILHAGLEVATARRAGRGAPELYEGADTQRDVTAKYARLRFMYPREKIVNVDASRSFEDVLAACLTAVDEVVGEEVRAPR